MFYAVIVASLEHKELTSQVQNLQTKQHEEIANQGRKQKISFTKIKSNSSNGKEC